MLFRLLILIIFTISTLLNPHTVFAYNFTSTNAGGTTTGGSLGGFGTEAQYNWNQANNIYTSPLLAQNTYKASLVDPQNKAYDGGISLAMAGLALLYGVPKSVQVGATLANKSDGDMGYLDAQAKANEDFPLLALPDKVVGGAVDLAAKGIDFLPEQLGGVTPIQDGLQGIGSGVNYLADNLGDNVYFALDLAALAGAAGAASKGVSNLAKPANPLTGTTYSPKVINQMNNTGDLYHNFPKLVDNFVTDAKITQKPGGDGIIRTHIELPGSINGEQGVYKWIIEPDKTIKHRLFEPGEK